MIQHPTETSLNYGDGTLVLPIDDRLPSKYFRRASSLSPAAKVNVANLAAYLSGEYLTCFFSSYFAAASLSVAVARVASLFFVQRCHQQFRLSLVSRQTSAECLGPCLKLTFTV